jgi:transcriptional regulator with XRE-family HTH domain
MSDGFKLAELARESGLTKSSLVNYEYGSSPLSFEAGNQICARLGLNQLWLATGKGEQRPFVNMLDLPSSAAELAAAKGLDFYGAFAGPLRQAMEKWRAENPAEKLIEETLKRGPLEALQQMSRARLETLAVEQVAAMRKAIGPLKMAHLRLVRDVLTELEKRCLWNKGVDFDNTVCDLSPMQIAKRLKATRERLALTQGQAADKWGVSVRAIQSWEQGKRRPRGLALRQLEAILSSENQPTG